jgi:Domain of unknown function (DUF4367)
MNENIDRKTTAALSNIADALIERTDSSRFDPTVLMQRTGDPIMNDNLDDLATNIENGRGAVGPIHGPAPSRKRANIFRFGLGALCGVLVTGGVFAVRNNTSKNKTDTKLTTQRPANPLLLKSSAAPKDLCLQNIMTYEDSDMYGQDQNQPKIFKRADGAGLIFTLGTGYYGSNGTPVGETLQINGHKALYVGQGDKGSLSWKQGATYISISGSKVPKTEFVTIAESLQLSFSENGPQIAGLKAPGFVSTDASQSDFMPYGSINYGNCKATFDNEPTRFVGISTAPENAQELSELFTGSYGGSAPKTTKVPAKVTRNGKQIDATKITTKYPGAPSDNISLNWIEKNAYVSVGYALLTDEEIAAFIDGLQPATLAELDAMKDDVKTPSYPDPGNPNKTEEKIAGTIALKKGKLTIKTATSDGKLCVGISIGGGSSGSQCMKADPDAVFAMAMGMNKMTASQVVTPASTIKATATLPDGSSVDIPSFQDPRLPSMRVFVLVQQEDDPIPTKIAFTDAAGKVVKSQTGADVPTTEPAIK